MRLITYSGVIENRNTMELEIWHKSRAIAGMNLDFVDIVGGRIEAIKFLRERLHGIYYARNQPHRE